MIIEIKKNKIKYKNSKYNYLFKYSKKWNGETVSFINRGGDRL